MYYKISLKKSFLNHLKNYFLFYIIYIKMFSNFAKREKTYNKHMTEFKTHPNYSHMQTLYINSIIKSIPSAKKMLTSVKLTKKGAVYKSSMSKYNDILQKYETLKTKQEAKKLEVNLINKRVLKLDDDKINNKGYNYLTNKIEFNKIRRDNPGCYYVQDVKFYDNKGKLINSGIYENLFFDYIYTGHQLSNSKNQCVIVHN